MRRHLLLWLLLAVALAAEPFDRVEVETAKTSIYLGNVSLRMTTLRRDGDQYLGEYDAKVFPFFFSSEKGTLFINCTVQQLEALQRGERVPFTGGGRSTAGDERRVEGHVTPDGPQSTSGKIKVRIFVSRKIQLIFNTTYRFVQ
ncbi:MAG: hypothetical protein SFV32_11610 [Opitutaceae bacterium]|nr:hypothetical protein [Opitutaceae bacterium]